MKAQQYRPSITNGQITQRRARPVAAAVRPARRKTNSSSNQQNKTGGVRGSRILGVMLLLGLLLTGGFLLGIHSQISALHLNQAEESLKTELDRAANEQKFLDLEQRRTLNLTESERASRAEGYAPLDLDRRNQSYRVIPASYTRPAAPANEAAEEQNAAKASARPKALAAKPARPVEVKVAKAPLPNAKLGVKPATKLAAAPVAKAASQPKLAAKPMAKPGKAAAPQGKPANKVVAKPSVAKLAKVTQAKRTR